MIELKVRKFGKSLGVVLPNDVINRLQINVGEPVFLIEADGGYLLTQDPVSKKAEDIINRYRDTLRALKTQ